MEFEVEGEIIEWRGPAPFLFVAMDPDDSDLLRSLTHLSYGWGCYAARVQLGATSYTTSLMPKDGVLMVPVKVAVQRAEKVGLGDRVSMTVEVSEP
ncbi:DUF1905 domain-containing protein [Aestuariimicrobium ganziense]|uniref:DUF1905 domain-containing protein n=1 Tax=Aestuariimicrobium ganziense TaxID=2773677 RepID=UPI001943D986|nr:DUF1905 domain-containing protein [Aestuariimicrobium ganziense]